MADAELSVRISGDASDLESAISGVEKSLKGLEKTTANATNKVNKETEKTANAWKQTGEKLKNVGEGIDTVTKPIQRLSTVTAAGAVASAKFAIDFENNFANVEKTVDGTDSQLKKIKQDIIDMTTVGINSHSAIPQTTAELTKLAAAGGQLGIQTENISSFTETMAMMGSATNLAGEEGAKTLARFMNVTATSQDKVQNLGSATVDLGNHFATTEAEIADMAMNMGATGSAVGISAQDILAYSTALSSLGVEAAAGGSSVSRIWMDIQSAVSSGGKALEAFAKISGKSATQFADDWKGNASGAFKDMLTGLSKSKDIVGDLQKLGFENIRDLQALQKLAGPQGIQLLNDALDRSNRAWGENTALLNEFEKKAGTTASQLEVTKNNLIEAGRSVGEVLLPAVNSGAVNVKEFAQGIAKMNDTQKQALVTTGKWVIGLGAASKVTASGIKFVGSMSEGVAKIKQFAPALASVGSVAPQAALGIAAVTTAVVVGKKAYDAWYKSQYNWTEGLAESDNKVQNSLNNYKKLSDIQKTLKDAKLVIENPESSKEQIEEAKSKIEEIKGLLENEYNLKIKSDNSDLEDTVEHMQKLTGNELRKAIAEEEIQLSTLHDKYKQAMSDLPKLQEQYNNADARLTQFKEIKSELSALSAEYRSGAISQNEWNAAIEKAGQTMGLTSEQSMDYANVFRVLSEGINNAQKEVDDLNPKIEDLTNSQENYINISKSFANKLTEYMSEQLVSGDMDGAAKTIERIGKAAANAELDLEGYGKILTDIAKASGMINENQTIKISAEGDVSVIEEVEDAANELNGKQVELTINADGTEAYATIDGVQYKIASYDGETGEAILTADGTKADMVINRTTGEVHLFSNEEGIATLSAIDNVTETAKKVAKSIAGVESKTVTITAVYTTINKRVDQFSSLNGWATPKAKGTRNFEGGLAMVNDQKGTSDPREMIEVGGKGYIFEGKDVVLPLPKHAKVYTASQTKQMMNNAGIPRYANGKNNKAWENAKANWAHYTKINNVSAIEQLEHWDNMMIKFKNDAEVIKEIQEEIVASTKDMWNEDITTMQWFLDMGMDTQEHYYRWLEDYRDEHFEGDEEQWRKATLELHKWKKEQAEMLNTASEEYIKLHSAINDWASVGDGPLAAFERVRERMRMNVEDHLYTEEEANEYLKQLGSDLYSTYAEDADNWMQHEREYNAMSVEDYAAALTRKKNKLSEFLSNGIGEYTQYVEDIQKLDEQIMSAYAEGISNWRNDADFYQRQAEVFGWGFNGTGHKSAEEFWQARLDKELENAADTNLSKNERQSALRYADEARMEIYKARQAALDEELEKFRDSIENIRTEMDDEVQKIRDSWTKEDRTKDITETERQLALFRNAQTKEGMDKYKSLQDELLQLQREEQIADIEADNNERLVELQMQYERMERAKIDELAGLKDEVLNYGGISKIMSDSREIAAAANENIGGIIDSIESFGETFSSFKNELFEHMEAQNTGNVTYHTYNTSQNISNNIRDSADTAATWLKAASNLPMNRYGRRGW